jgi:hypothetical protein
MKKSSPKFVRRSRWSNHSPQRLFAVAMDAILGGGNEDAFLIGLVGDLPRGPSGC